MFLLGWEEKARSMTFVAIFIVGFFIGMKMICGKRICFHNNDANERGTISFVINLAENTRKLLKHDVLFIMPDPELTEYHTLRLTEIYERFPLVFYLPGQNDVVNPLNNSNYITFSRGDSQYVSTKAILENTWKIPLVHNKLESIQSFFDAIGGKDQKHAKRTRVSPKISNFPARIRGKVGGRALPAIALINKCDVIYIAKAGSRNSQPAFPESFSCNLSTIVHGHLGYEKHGTVFGGVNKEMVDKSLLNENEALILPLIIPQAPEFPASVDLRQHFHIPQNAFVICRHGGFDTFNLPMVHEAIELMVKSHDGNMTKLHFLFLGTKIFYSHPRIHYLPTSIDPYLKESFFTACDAMIHGRRDGETFGLAIAEFSVRQKPIITHLSRHNFPDAAEHIRILGDRVFLYKSKEELIDIVSSFLANGVPKRDYNAYRKFSPENVSNSCHNGVSFFIPPYV